MQAQSRKVPLAALLTRPSYVLAFMSFPRTQAEESTPLNPLERLNGEDQARTTSLASPQGVCHHPLVAAILLEQNDDGPFQRARDRTLETMLL